VGPDERAVGALLEQRLPLARGRLWLDRDAGQVRAERGVGRGREVLDVDDRPPGRAPRREEAGDVGLGVRVAPPAVLRVVQTLLNVDDEKGGVRGDHPSRKGALTACWLTAQAVPPVDSNVGVDAHATQVRRTLRQL